MEPSEFLSTNRAKVQEMLIITLVVKISGVRQSLYFVSIIVTNIIIIVPNPPLPPHTHTPLLSPGIGWSLRWKSYRCPEKRWKQIPAQTRPARPRRCKAFARDTHTTSRDSIPLLESYLQHKIFHLY